MEDLTAAAAEDSASIDDASDGGHVAGVGTTSGDGLAQRDGGDCGGRPLAVLDVEARRSEEAARTRAHARRETG